VGEEPLGARPYDRGETDHRGVYRRLQHKPAERKGTADMVADYVLAGYGTGAIMAVPAHDSRDFAFARHFDLPIIQVVKKPGEDETDPQQWSESYDAKEGVMVNSGFINGMSVKEAIKATIKKIGENERRLRKSELPPEGCDLQPSALLGRAFPGILQGWDAVYA